MLMTSHSFLKSAPQSSWIFKGRRLNLEDNMSSLLAVRVLVVHHSSLADSDEKPTNYSNQIFDAQMKCAMPK